MSYDAAINKAWGELVKLNPVRNLAQNDGNVGISNGVNPPNSISVRFLADEYTIDLGTKRILSLSCNAPTKDFLAILILHYLVQKLKGLPRLTGEWLSFKELSGIEGYYSAFRKRSIEPIIRKYGAHPEGLLEDLDRLPGKRVDQGDIGLVLQAFEGVPVLISFWRGDEEFGPDANMLFDKSITKIFYTEDIVVLAGFIAASL